MGMGISLGIGKGARPAQYGPNLSPDGSVTTGWTGFNSTLSAPSGRLVITNTAGGAMAAYTALLTVEAGATYEFSYDFFAEAVTGNTFAYIGTTLVGAEISNRNLGSTLGVYETTFVAPGTSVCLSFATSGLALAGETVTFGSVKLRRKFY